MKRIGIVVLAIVVIGVAGCGRVNRPATKKNIIKSFEGSDVKVTDDETKCAANLIDGYSDKEILKIDKAMSAADFGNTDPAVSGFLGKAIACIAPAFTRDAASDFPDMTDEDRSCMTGYFEGVGAKMLTDAQTAQSIELIKACPNLFLSSIVTQLPKASDSEKACARKVISATNSTEFGSPEKFGEKLGLECFGRSAILAGLASEFPSATAEQTKCASDYVNALSDEDAKKIEESAIALVGACALV
jgi:hypothetical protein